MSFITSEAKHHILVPVHVTITNMISPMVKFWPGPAGSRGGRVARVEVGGGEARVQVGHLE